MHSLKTGPSTACTSSRVQVQRFTQPPPPICVRLTVHLMGAQAAVGAIRVYLQLHDKPLGASNGTDEEAALAGMSLEERKKYKLAKKKEVGSAVGDPPLGLQVDLRLGLPLEGCWARGFAVGQCDIDQYPKGLLLRLRGQAVQVFLGRYRLSSAATPLGHCTAPRRVAARHVSEVAPGACHPKRCCFVCIHARGCRPRVWVVQRIHTGMHVCVKQTQGRPATLWSSCWLVDDWLAQEKEKARKAAEEKEREEREKREREKAAAQKGGKKANAAASKR
jgi:hypothetical protein